MVVRNISAAKAELSALIEAVQSGSEVIIAKAGKPVARLMAFRGPAKPVARPMALRGPARADKLARLTAYFATRTWLARTMTRLNEWYACPLEVVSCENRLRCTTSPSSGL